LIQTVLAQIQNLNCVQLTNLTREDSKIVLTQNKSLAVKTTNGGRQKRQTTLAEINPVQLTCLLLG